MRDDNFESLLRDGDPDSLKRAYEELLASERGRKEIAELKRNVESEVDIDWTTLERIALRRTPVEWLEHRLGSIPVWVSLSLAFVLAVFGLFATHGWAAQALVDDDFISNLVVLLVISVVITLSVMTISLALYAIARGLYYNFRRSSPIASFLAFPSDAPDQWRGVSPTLIVAALVVLAIGGMYWFAKNDGPSESTVSVNELGLEGVQALIGGDYEKAIDRLERATNMDADLTNPNLHVWLGNAYERKYSTRGLVWGSGHGPDQLPDELQKARHVFEKVYEKYPTNWVAINSIANVYSLTGDFEQAKGWHLKGTVLEPIPVGSLVGIGMINWRLSHGKAATNEDVKNLTPEEKVQMDKWIEEGINALKKALEIKPNRSDALQYLSLLYREKAKLAEDEQLKEQLMEESARFAFQALEQQDFPGNPSTTSIWQ